MLARWMKKINRRIRKKRDVRCGDEKYTGRGNGDEREKERKEGERERQSDRQTESERDRESGERERGRRNKRRPTWKSTSVHLWPELR